MTVIVGGSINMPECYETREQSAVRGLWGPRISSESD